MDGSVRFIQGFLALSLGITLAKLSGDSGGGDYFFTLVWLVLAGNAAPYLIALRVMRRARRDWGRAVGTATIAFGIVDATVRMQAFFFPTYRSGGGMALWLPISSLAFIPMAAVIVHTAVGVFTRES